MLALVLIVVVVTSIWAAADAAQHDWSDQRGPFGLPMGWPVVLMGCLLLWIVAFPCYIAERRKVPDRA
jgi:hypothetical protein